MRQFSRVGRPVDHSTGLSKSRAAARVAVRAAAYVVPKSRSAVVRSFPDFDDQARSVVTQCLAAAIPCTVLVSGSGQPVPGWARAPLVRTAEVGSSRGLISYLRAKYVFYTHGLYLSPTPARGQVVVNMWHGMPIKKISGQLGERFLPRFTYTLSSRSVYDAAFQEAFEIDVGSILRCPLPRTDLLHSPRASGLSRQPYIVILPTYRTSKLGVARRDGEPDGDRPSSAEISRLSSALESAGLLAYVKQHPMAEPWPTTDWKSDQIIYLTDSALLDWGVSLYELVGGARCLITDYSSIAVDVQDVGGCVVMVQSDQAEYELNRGFNLTLAEMNEIGPVVRSYAELADMIVGTPSFFSTPICHSGEVLHAASKLFSMLGISNQ